MSKVQLFTVPISDSLFYERPNRFKLARRWTYKRFKYGAVAWNFTEALRSNHIKNVFLLIVRHSETAVVSAVKAHFTVIYFSWTFVWHSDTAVVSAAKAQFTVI